MKPINGNTAIVVESTIVPQVARQIVTPSFPAVPDNCPTCGCALDELAHGWVRRSTPHEDHAGHNKKYGYCEVPCPTCTGDAYQRRIAHEQAVLVHRLFGDSHLPWDTRNWTFETFPVHYDQRSLKIARRFVALHLANPDAVVPRGLYLAGPTGIGKTGLGVCMLKTIMQAGKVGLFVMAPDLMDKLRAAQGKESQETADDFLRVITRVPWLVLDDVGVERPTDYVIERFYLIVQKRRSQGLYTIFTSNLSMANLGEHWKPKDAGQDKFHAGLRVTERLREYCQPITVESPSLRGGK